MSDLISEAGADHFAQVMRRDIGRHADRDAARAVDQQVGEAGGQNLRLAFRSVVVRLEIDGVLVPIVQQRVRRSEEHTSELQSLMRISYAVFCLKKQNHMYKML